MLVEIIISFKESSGKNINLDSDKDENKIDIQRFPEIIYGLRNFIGNAVKFSNEQINVSLKSNSKFIIISINDDGPGFAEDIKKLIGEPYIRSKSKEINSNSGTGLGALYLDLKLTN